MQRLLQTLCLKRPGLFRSRREVIEGAEGEEVEAEAVEAVVVVEARKSPTR